MKKIIALMLVFSMSICFAACGNKVQELPAADPDVGQPAEPDTPAEMLPDIGVDAETEAVLEGDTMGQILRSDFVAQLDRDPAASAQQIADALLQNPVIEFAGASMAVEPGLLTGFGNAEISGFKEGVMFAPAIGSIAFVGYIFILDEGTDPVAFTEALSSNADPRWNICVEAEETVVDHVGGTVFFLMCPGQ